RQKATVDLGAPRGRALPSHVVIHRELVGVGAETQGVVFLLFHVDPVGDEVFVEDVAAQQEGMVGLSETALFFIGGILKHAPALTCLTNPTTNSYKRLVPGFEAPVNLAYSARNRSAAIRIPTYSPSPKAKRIEFRTPDAAANPYLAFSALLLAGLDGIQNRLDPGDPLDKNLYDLPPEELAQVASVPDSLRGAIEALQADHSFLLRGDVFNE